MWKPLTYTLKDKLTNDQSEIELPFMIGVISDLAGHNQELMPRFRDRQFRDVDCNNLNKTLYSIAPFLRLNVPNVTKSDGHPLSVKLHFEQMSDFEPASIAEQLDGMGFYTDLHSVLSDLSSFVESQPEPALQMLNLLTQGNINNAVFIWRKNSNLKSAHNSSDYITLLEELVTRIDKETTLKQFDAMLRESITDMEDIISRQLDQVIHHPEFQALEAGWRGLEYLCSRHDTGAGFKLRVMCATKRELYRDAVRAVEFDHAQLFKKLYDSSFAIPGETPYSLLVADYQMSHSNDDIDLIVSLSNICATVHLPWITGADPALFGMKGFPELTIPRDVERIFDTSDYIRWRSLREIEDIKYTFIAMPRILARLPWNADKQSEQNNLNWKIKYTEQIAQHSDYLWMNAAWGVATVIADSFARDRWPANIHGAQYGRFKNLNAHILPQEDGTISINGPVETLLSDRLTQELNRLGLLTVKCNRTSHFAYVEKFVSLHKPEKHNDAYLQVKSNAMMQIEHLLSLGRIMLTIRSILDHYSGTMQPEELQDWLSNWLDSYTIQGDEDDTADLPLRSSDIEFEAIPDMGELYQYLILKTRLHFNYRTEVQSIEAFTRTHVSADYFPKRLIP
ncbi:MAG: type VI secretion system contractile sheath large subunit [Gammaproteobacteria bacterium]|nr:type VI secretion system contractile sheath large subunit [Gammaproteobacteria bacterium]